MKTAEGINTKSNPQIIGKIQNVKTAFVSVILDSIDGGQDGTGVITVGDFVIMPSDDYYLFGQITDINSTSKVSTALEFEANVKLLLSIKRSDRKVISGVVNKPRVGSTVYLAPVELIQLITDPSCNIETGANQMSLQIAKLQHASDIPVSFTPETIFGRHCAIFGTTGSGKSWTIARLLEETSKFNSKVILFDATGEFHTLGPRVTHVHLGKYVNAPLTTTEVVMPYNELTENDIFAIFEPKGQSQALKLRTAIKTLKLAQLEPQLALDGTVLKANKSKAQYERAYKTHINKLERPYANFNIKYLSRQIGNECVKPVRSASETNYWGEKNNIEHSECIPLIARIDDMLQSETLAPIFHPEGKKSILRTVEEFLLDQQKSVLRISLEHLSFEHSAREIIANSIGRFLLTLGRLRQFKKKPVFVVVDEAHQFLNNQINDEELKYALDSFSLIAKEGRKYCLSLGIVTQRPRDIPQGVLSQVGTFIVHRLINDYDLSVIERASGRLDNQTMEAIPTLSPGEAVLLGVEFPIPLRIVVDASGTPPNSDGPNYQQYWK